LVKLINRKVETCAATAQEIIHLKDRVKELDNEVMQLRVDKDNSLNDLAIKTAAFEAAHVKINALKAEIKMKEHLVNSATKIRPGSLEDCKRFWRRGGYKFVRRGLNLEVIWARNKAAHKGNYLAYKSLFDLGILHTISDRTNFLYIYDTFKELSPREVEIANMRATMIACGYKTTYSHDQNMDLRFDMLYDECIEVWRSTEALAISKEEKWKQFDRNFWYDKRRRRWRELHRR